MPQDTQLKSLLERAKTVCTHKHNQVAAGLNGTPSSKFVELHKEQNSLFVLLIQPAFFVNEIPTIDKPELEIQITAIDVLDPSQFNEYLTTMGVFLAHLKEKVLIHLPIAIESDQTSDWNLKALDALRMMRRKITGRKRYFNNLGADLGNDAVYKHHRISRKDYREKLKKNKIQSLATDIIVLDKFRDKIAGLKDLAKFIESLKKVNVFIDKKRKIASDTPVA